MRVLVAGGTGVIGRQLVPLLVDGAHEVTVVARSTRRAASVDGAQVAVADALDRDALRRVVEAAAPEAVVNLLTALPQKIDPIRIERQLRQTNRLRTLGTANLYDVARTAGVRQIVAEGLGWVYPPSSDVQDESVPLWLGAPKRFRAAAAALDELERRTLAAPGAVVLRFGHLYGPGTAWAADGTTTRQIRKRRLPIIGEGRGVFSFVHVTDAARAIVAPSAATAGARSTSSTTTQRRHRSGCRSWPASSEPSRPGGFRPAWRDTWSASSASIS